MKGYSAGRMTFFTVLSVKILAVIAVFFVLGVDGFLWSDSAVYLDLGQNIYEGNGFSNSVSSGTVFTPEVKRTPLYPLLVGFFDSFVPYGLVFVSLLQALAAAFVAVFVYRLGAQFVSSKAAMSAALVISLEPLISAMHILVMPEVFLVLFILMFIYYFMEYIKQDRPKYLMLAVLALSVSMYIKPITTYLFILPVIWLLWRKNGLRNAFAFILLLFVLIMPWMIRNSVAVGQFDFTKDDTGNICNWELTGVLATKYGVDPTDWNKTVYLPEYKSVQDRCTSVFAAYKIFLFEYPGAFIKTSFLSALSMLTNEGYTVFFEKSPEEQVKIHHNYLTPAVFANSDWAVKIRLAAKEFGSAELIAVVLGKIFWLLAGIFALVGFINLIFVRKSSFALFLAFVVLYFIVVTVISTGYGVGARLRYPIDPFLIIFGVYGVGLLLKKFRRFFALSVL